MLPKKNRADKKAIDRIFKEGRFLNSPSLSFKYTKVAGGEPRISFIVPKSTAKLAVKRNALRRLGYLALSKQEKKLPKGLTGAFVFKKYQDNNETLKNEIETILSKIN